MPVGDRIGSARVASIVVQRRRGPTYGLISASHPSIAPMDTSPGHIVCCNRLDTTGEVLYEEGLKSVSGSLIPETLLWTR